MEVTKDIKVNFELIGVIGGVIIALIVLGTILVCVAKVCAVKSK